MTSTDIYSILASKPHNPHYLKRYYKFIQSFKSQIRIQHETERHHICPKAKDLFPEYTSFKSFPWNLVNLTFKQHLIAHHLLYKAYNTVSMANSIMFTLHGHHKEAPIKIHQVNLVAFAKRELSMLMTGKFTRGYDEHGTPNVSCVTKQKLSKLKTEYYSDPKNILKCKEIRASSAYDIANIESSIRFTKLNKSRTGIPLSESHVRNFKIAQKEALKDINKRGAFSGFYVTPIGVFSSIHSHKFNSYCKTPYKKVNKHMTSHSNILNVASIGMTCLELGFYFIERCHPQFEQYHESLDLIHPPAPNHALWSELNDYLSHEKLLP